jgi:hypothetical protein
VTKWTFKYLLVFFLFSSQAFGDNANTLIIYPEVGKGQEQVYSSVIKGIENEIEQPKLLELKDGQIDIQQQLDEIRPLKIIALGKSAAEAANKSSYRKQTLTGLSYFTKSEYNGVSLIVNSRTLAGLLHQVAPFIQRIFIVQQSGHHTIAVQPTVPGDTPTIFDIEGSDSLETIRLLGRLLEHDVSAPTDAVFIPANITDDIRQEMEKVAWNKKIMLLSTNFSHLETGIPMVFYPDPVALGGQLGRLAGKKSLDGFENAASIYIGLNRRAAQHIDLAPPSQKTNLFSVQIN